MFQGTHWKEALKILKLVVTRSSTLVAPPTSMHGSSWESSLASPHPSFTDTEIFTKKELPGECHVSVYINNAHLLLSASVIGSVSLSFSLSCDAACMHGTDDLFTQRNQVATRIAIEIDCNPTLCVK